MTHPTLVIGHHNEAEWVENAQKLLNAVAPTMSLEHLPENGVFDEAMEAAVKAFQGRAGIGVDGKIGPDTWTALWTEWNARQDQHQAQAAVQEGLAPAPGHQEPAEQHDPPPTRQEIDRGRDLVHAHVGEIAERANAFAEAVDKMGPPNEVLPKIIDGAHTAVDLAEILGAGEASAAIGSALFVGSVAGTILVPFTMWYEAIQANNAGELTAYRWSVYHPWVDGYLAGLYGGSPGEVDHLFVPVRDSGYQTSAGLSSEDKKCVIALLLFASNVMGFTDEPDQISASDWALSGEDHGWTRHGLETLLSAH